LIAEQLHPGEVPKVACRIDQLWIAEKRMAGNPFIVVTNEGLMLAAFVKKLISVETDIQSVSFDEIASVSAIEKITFSLTLKRGPNIRVRGAGALSKKYTQAVYDAIVEGPRIVPVAGPLSPIFRREL